MKILIWLIVYKWFILVGILAVLWLGFLLFENQIKEWWEENTGYEFVVPGWMDFTDDD